MRRVTFGAVVPALLPALPTLSGHGGEPSKDDKLSTGGLAPRRSG
jgi:hypothetical protein